MAGFWPGHPTAELALLLITLDGKGGDGRDELVVAEGLEGGDSAVRRAEGESEGETIIRIAPFGMMEIVGQDGKPHRGD